MPATPEQQRGRKFEAEAAKALALSPTVNSGTRHDDRSDARGRIRLSAKANPTTKRTWAETRRQLAEAIDMAAGTGEVPVLAIEDNDGTQLLLMRLSDGVSLLTEEARAQKIPTRSDQIRERSKIPLLLRGAEHE